MSSTSAARTQGSQSSIGVVARTGGTAATLAIAANLAVLGVANLAEADMTVQWDPNQPALTVGVFLVVVTSLIPMLFAAILLIPARRWGNQGWRVMALIGLTVGVVTMVMPLSVQASADTKIALGLMHILASVAWFVAVRWFAKREWSV